MHRKGSERYLLSEPEDMRPMTSSTVRQNEMFFLQMQKDTKVLFAGLVFHTLTSIEPYWIIFNQVLHKRNGAVIDFQIWLKTHKDFANSLICFDGTRGYFSRIECIKIASTILRHDVLRQCIRNNRFENTGLEHHVLKLLM